MQTRQSAYVLNSHEGTSLWFAGARVVVKALGNRDGAFPSVLEQVVPPGYATPVHVHHTEDESWYVLEGQVTFRCGEATLTAGPGAFVFAPRGVPHVLINAGTEPARTLIITPPGFGQFVQEASEPAAGPGFPSVPPDPERLAAIAAKHGIDIVGPPPSS